MSKALEVGGRVVAGVVGDVRFIVVLAIGVGAGVWLARYHWQKWEKGLFHPPLIGRNPDRTTGPVVAVPPAVPPKPPPATTQPPRNLPPVGRPWGTSLGRRAAVV